MILSVVVVSYNVKFFLEQCLSSLQKASEGSMILRGQVQVIIVDNASTDGSLKFLQPLFPDFHFIQNAVNIGFAKANNQALSLCTGEFILFLNPDTILPEDCPDTCVSFLRQTPGAGALGVQMLDGNGRYLKESKRGFPDALTAFYKMTGLASLFPRSKVFAAYYMGHLSEKSSQAVDILSGAFMMVKKSVLDITGGFDEQFFMYGEDIDLSYRISRTGFQNYYLAETSIIHFKGESTRKDSRYIKTFYGAMKLFMKKHISRRGSSLSLAFLNAGIRLHQLMIYLVLPLRRPSSTQNRMPFFIQGNPEQKKNWENALREKNIPCIEIKNQAGQIIFCESVVNSWKSILREIRELKDPKSCYFSGNGTHAAVGSHSSREPGRVLELYPDHKI